MAQETARGIVSLADPQATSFVMTSTGTKAKWHIWEEGRPWLACGQDYDPEADEIAVSSSSHPSSALCGTWDGLGDYHQGLWQACRGLQD